MGSLIALLKQYRSELTAVILLMVAVFLMLAVRTGTVTMHSVRGVIIDMVSPIQSLILSPRDAFYGARSWWTGIENLTLENQALRLQLQTLKAERIRTQSLAQENLRLRNLLNMPPKPGFIRLSARVRGESSSAFARSIILDAGTIDGLRRELAVVTPDGLVGRVAHVSQHGALVLTLLDINSRVPVLIQRSRVRGIIAGNNGSSLQMTYVAKGTDVAVEDMIVTSGTGGIFPKGLLVGRVAAIDRGGIDLYQKVTVKPAVRFELLEEVSLLVPEDPERFATAERLAIADDLSQSGGGQP
ncbi:MAG: rod shape-determining protein MreC [Magnetococcales bacterium]|nr:rod shape-determining protein MreC [Magnetococcales bacterium]